MNHFSESCSKSVVFYCIGNIVQTGFMDLILKNYTFSVLFLRHLSNDKDSTTLCVHETIFSLIFSRSLYRGHKCKCYQIQAQNKRNKIIGLKAIRNCGSLESICLS